MTRFFIDLDDGFSTTGIVVRADSKEQAIEKIKTDPNYRLFRNQKILRVTSEQEANCVLED